jgi:hypothetical protein
MWDLMGSMLNWIIPPPDADRAANVSWRWRVAIFTALSFFGVICLAVLSFGFIPLAFSGFATATALEATVTEQRQHWVYQLDKQVLDYRIDQCHAPTPEARQLYFSKMQWLLEEYQRINRQAYVLPTCAEL